MRRYFSGVYRDGNGRVVTSGTISVLLSGTTTPANIYTTFTGVSAVYSVTSSSTDGSFSFYVDDLEYGSYQQYDIILSKTGYNPSTYTTIELQPILGTYAISTAKTISYPVVIPYGVVYSVSVSGSMTFTSTVQAGQYQIFSGSGSIVFTNNKMNIIYPVWFGENTTPGTTDYITVLNKAKLATPIGSTLLLPAQTMGISSTFEMDREINYIGEDVQYTVFKKLADVIGVRIGSKTNAKGQQQRIKNFTILGTNGSDTTDGMEIWSGTTGQIIDNIYSIYNGGHGVHFRSGLIGCVSNIYSYHNAGDGFRITGASGYGGGAANANLFMNINCLSNTGSGFRIINASGYSTANVGINIVCQQNGAYGVCVSDLNNTLIIYAESNTLYDVYLDSNSTRNFITINAMGSYATKFLNAGSNNIIIDLSNNLGLMIPTIRAPMVGSNVVGNPLTSIGGKAGDGVSAKRGGANYQLGGDGNNAGGAGGHVYVQGGSPGGSGTEFGTTYIQATGGDTVVGKDQTTNIIINSIISLTGITTTQRDALTASNGMIIFNSSTGKHQARSGGAWVDLY